MTAGPRLASQRSGALYERATVRDGHRIPSHRKTFDISKARLATP
jgi:hypothetical protein